MASGTCGVNTALGFCLESCLGACPGDADDGAPAEEPSVLEELAAIQEDAADTDAEERVASDNSAMVEAEAEATEDDSSESDAPAVNATANATEEEACSPTVPEILIANDGSDLLEAFNAR